MSGLVRPGSGWSSSSNSMIVDRFPCSAMENDPRKRKRLSSEVRRGRGLLVTPEPATPKPESRYPSRFTTSPVALPMAINCHFALREIHTVNASPAVRWRCNLPTVTGRGAGMTEDLEEINESPGNVERYVELLESRVDLQTYTAFSR